MRTNRPAYQLAAAARILVLDREYVFVEIGVGVLGPGASASTDAPPAWRRGTGTVALRCGVPLHGNGKSAKVSGLLNKQINLIAV